MANSVVAVDQDQQWLLNCLSATLDPNQEVRSFAEASLNQASFQPGHSLSQLFVYCCFDFFLTSRFKILITDYLCVWEYFNSDHP